MECNVNYKIKPKGRADLSFVIKTRSESIADRSTDGRISRRVGPKQGQSRISRGEPESIASIFSSVDREHNISRFKA